jgi:hypothetical protein
VTPDASKELGVASTSTGGKMDDISFEELRERPLLRSQCMYASHMHDYNGGLLIHLIHGLLSQLRLQLCVIGVLVMMDAKRLDHFRQW